MRPTADSHLATLVSPRCDVLSCPHTFCTWQHWAVNIRRGKHQTYHADPCVSTPLYASEACGTPVTAPVRSPAIVPAAVVRLLIGIGGLNESVSGHSGKEGRGRVVPRSLSGLIYKAT